MPQPASAPATPSTSEYPRTAPTSSPDPQPQPKFILPADPAPDAEPTTPAAPPAASAAAARVCRVCGGSVAIHAASDLCSKTPECRREKARLRYQAHRARRGVLPPPEKGLRVSNPFKTNPRAKPRQTRRAEAPADPGQPDPVVASPALPQGLAAASFELIDLAEVLPGNTLRLWVGHLGAYRTILDDRGRVLRQTEVARG